MMSHVVFRRVLPVIVIGTLFLVLGSAEHSAQAGGVITTCDWPSLQAALAEGGLVTFGCDGTIIVPEIVISVDTTINGNGHSVTLSGNLSNRVFYVAPGATLNLDGLTIADGNASGSWGGGLYNGGTTTIANSEFIGNTAYWGGGGLTNAGMMTITGSSFTGNTAQDGGAIYVSAGTLALTDSTLSGNSGSECCGGVAAANDTTTITNSTIHGNSSGELAAGIGRFGPDTEVTIIASTITNNTVLNGAGGGLWNAFHPGSLTIRNTIVAGNSAGVGPDCKGDITSEGYNLIESAADCNVTGATADDLMEISPLLGPLENNGGGTLTQAVLAGSPAIDYIPEVKCVVTADQRGIPRPQDSDGDGTAACEIGAYEVGDSDGVSDAVENGAPNGGDGNGDGVLDSLQANVASLPNLVDGQYITLVSPAGTQLADVTTIDNPSPGDTPPDVDFPVGFVSFNVQGIAPGGATTATLLLPLGTTVETYYKYGPTPDNPDDHWYEFLFDGTTGAELGSSQVVLHLVDGVRGDSDLSENGVVTEPGAPTHYLVMPVSIDIRPGSSRNLINLRSNRAVPVAIFSATNFDATMVNPATVTLAQAPVAMRHGRYRTLFWDVNRDRLTDLIVLFDTDQMQLGRDDTLAVLEGATYAGLSIRGSDSVIVIPRLPHLPDVPSGGCLEETHPAWTRRGLWIPYFQSSASGGMVYVHVGSRPRPNTYMELTFGGDGFALIYHKSPYGGIANLYVDDMRTPYAQIDMYAEEDLWLGDAVLQVSGLDPETVHVLRIVPTGDANPLARGAVITIDRVDLPVYDDACNGNGFPMPDE